MLAILPIAIWHSPPPIRPVPQPLIAPVRHARGGRAPVLHCPLWPDSAWRGDSSHSLYEKPRALTTNAVH